MSTLIITGCGETTVVNNTTNVVNQTVNINGDNNNVNITNISILGFILNIFKCLNEKK